jgi:hypothetical protein
MTGACVHISMKPCGDGMRMRMGSMFDRMTLYLAQY